MKFKIDHLKEEEDGSYAWTNIYESELFRNQEDDGNWLTFKPFQLDSILHVKRNVSHHDEFDQMRVSVYDEDTGFMNEDDLMTYYNFNLDGDEVIEYTDSGTRVDGCSTMQGQGFHPGFWPHSSRYEKIFCTTADEMDQEKAFYLKLLIDWCEIKDGIGSPFGPPQQ